MEIKTVDQWLDEKLSPEELEEFRDELFQKYERKIVNTQEAEKQYFAYFERKSRTFQEVICEAFRGSETKQGESYWAKIALR